MSTLGAVISDVKLNLAIVDSEQDAILANFVRTALRQLRKKRYWFLLKRSNLILVSGGSSVTLPSDYSSIRTVHLISGNQIYTSDTGFHLVKYDDFYSMYVTSSTVASGIPSACTVIENATENTILFDAAATTTLTVPVTYYMQDATLPVNTSDTSVWFDDGYDLVRALTQLLYQRYAQQDTQAATDEVTFYTNSLNDQNNFQFPVL